MAYKVDDTGSWIDCGISKVNLRILLIKIRAFFATIGTQMLCQDIVTFKC